MKTKADYGPPKRKGVGLIFTLNHTANNVVHRLKMPCTVLVCSKDLVLLETRSLVLATAGFRVVSVDIRDVTNMPPGTVDLVVIGHTLSDEQRDAMIAASRERWPNVKILRLVRSTHGHIPTGENEYECDSHSPHQLVEMCQKLTQ